MKHATESRTGWDYENASIEAGMFTKKLFLQAAFYIGTFRKVHQIKQVPEFKLNWVIWSHL